MRKKFFCIALMSCSLLVGCGQNTANNAGKDQNISPPTDQVQNNATANLNEAQNNRSANQRASNQVDTTPPQAEDERLYQAVFNESVQLDDTVWSKLYSGETGTIPVNLWVENLGDADYIMIKIIRPDGTVISEPGNDENPGQICAGQRSIPVHIDTEEKFDVYAIAASKGTYPIAIYE